jgi:hypothetical protein
VGNRELLPDQTNSMKRMYEKFHLPNHGGPFTSARRCRKTLAHVGLMIVHVEQLPPQTRANLVRSIIAGDGSEFLLCISYQYAFMIPLDRAQTLRCACKWPPRLFF